MRYRIIPADLDCRPRFNELRDEVFLASRAVEPCGEEILPWLPSGL
jgi:hypothetical protein